MTSEPAPVDHHALAQVLERHPPCPTPTKRRYPTQPAAVRAGDTSPIDVEAYECPCGWWHHRSRRN